MKPKYKASFTINNEPNIMLFAINFNHSFISVPPYTIAGGNPTKIIKKRFDDTLAVLLAHLKWWDFPPDKLAQFIPILCNDNLPLVQQTIENLLQ